MSEIPYSVRGGRSRNSGSGATTLDGLTDTNISNPQDADTLIYDNASSKWINSAGGGGATTLEALTDTNITSKQDNQIIKYNSGSNKWINSLPDPATSVNLGTTGTIITNSVAGFPNMLLASGGANVAPSWVSDISITSINYPADRAKNTSSADGSNPADVFINPSVATGGRFEVFTKTVGDTNSTQKFTINHKGAIGLGNALPVLNPNDFLQQVGTRPDYGLWGEILQSRGYDNQPIWLSKGSAGQVLTVASGSNTDLIWATPSAPLAQFEQWVMTGGNSNAGGVLYVFKATENMNFTKTQSNGTLLTVNTTAGNFTFNNTGKYKVEINFIMRAQDPSIMDGYIYFEVNNVFIFRAGARRNPGNPNGDTEVVTLFGIFDVTNTADVYTIRTGNGLAHLIEVGSLFIITNLA